MRKAGKTPLEYLVYDMSLVRVTSISSGGSGGEERLTENVTLNFEELTGTYTRQKEDGSADDPQEFFIPGSGCK